MLYFNCLSFYLSEQHKKKYKIIITRIIKIRITIEEISIKIKQIPKKNNLFHM